MSTGRKIAVIGIFSLGALTIAASITRMIVFIQAVQQLKKDFKSSGDNDLITTAGLYWSMIESGLGLLAACLPTIYHLLRKQAKTITDHSGTSGISLRSLSARNMPGHKKRAGSMSSEVQIVPGPTAQIQTRAERENVEYSESSGFRGEEIWINTTISRSENAA
jgi:hypothetical protein